jgi:hypothetical protein
VFTRTKNNFFWISRIAVVCADFRGHPKLRTKKLAFASAGNTYFMKRVMRGMVHVNGHDNDVHARAPKSVNLRILLAPSLKTKTFGGLMSLWMTGGF